MFGLDGLMSTSLPPVIGVVGTITCSQVLPPSSVR